jgi:hypothetical protein
MTQEINLYFPFFVLFYGLIMTFVTQIPSLRQKLAETVNQELVQWFYSHRMLGLVCCFVGGLWSLQRILIS